jgi:hypothetical protein
MTDDMYAKKLDELDRLIIDLNVPIDTDLIWSLLDEIIVGPQQEMSGRLSSAPG